MFLSKGLDKWRGRVAKDPRMTREYLEIIDLSISRLEWTIFTLNFFVGLALEQVRLFDKPQREKSAVNFSRSCQEHRDWTPYPVSHLPIDWHPNCHFLAYVSLAERVTKDEALYEERQETDPKEMAQRFEKLYTEIRKWPDTLPPCMRMSEKAMPHVIALQ
jgi:hypothetical protein